MRNSPFLCLGFIVAIAFTLIAPASAAHHGNSGAIVVPPVGPVLTSVTVPFGLLTQTGYGGVKLSAQNIALTPEYTTMGLGLEDLVHGTTCTHWTTTFSSGRNSGDFVYVSNVAEGSTAITPVPNTDNGSRGANHLSGNYVTNVFCTDISGNASNTATITYTGTAKAANVGTADSNFGGVFYPSGFGGTTGYQVLFSVGINRTTGGASALFATTPPAFANPVTYTFADLARRGAIADVELTTTNGGNINLTGLYFNADVATVPFITAAIYVEGGGSNFVFDDNHGRFTQAEVNTNTMGFLLIHGANIGTLSHSDCLWCASGVGDDGSFDSETWTFSNVYIRYWNNNCVYIAWLNHSHFTDFDCPSVISSEQHVDAFQIADGYTPQDINLLRFTAALADGNANSQGPIFPGGNHADFNGYIDDGTGAHGAGKILTITTVNDPHFAQIGSYLWGTSGPTQGSGDYISVDLNNGGGAPGTRYQLVAPGGNVIIGSPGTPVRFLGLIANPVTMTASEYDGYGASSAWAMNSNYGTSTLTNSTFARWFPSWFYKTTFNGHVTGSTLTVDAPVSGYQGVDYSEGMYLNYSGCNYCTQLTGQLTGTPKGPGTYSLSSSPGNTGTLAMYATADQDFGGTALHLSNFDVPNQYPGSFTLSGIAASTNFYGFGTSGPDCSIPAGPSGLSLCTVFPGGVAFSNNMWAVNNTTTLTNAYVAGNPATSFDAFGQAAWAALDNAGVKAKTCQLLTPKAGGALDLGGGAWIGAFMGGANAGKWNDGSGTVVPGC